MEASSAPLDLQRRAEKRWRSGGSCLLVVQETNMGGSLHNSVECGNRPVHYYSSLSINHCLDFTEKLENEVVCNGCDEPVLLGPAYKCSVSSECSFFIHKSCANSWFTKYVLKFLKIKVLNHFFDLIYSLHEINKSDDMFCRICGNKVNKEYAAYYRQQRSYILHTPKNFRDRYGESFATSELVSNEFIGRVTYLIKALNQAKEEGLHLGEIQHFSHLQHKLILCNGEIKDDKLC
jgi:hypothetical protein